MWLLQCIFVWNWGPHLCPDFGETWLTGVLGMESNTGQMASAYIYPKYYCAHAHYGFIKGRIGKWA